MKFCKDCGKVANPYVDEGCFVLCLGCAAKRAEKEKENGTVVHNKPKPNDAK